MQLAVCPSIGKELVAARYRMFQTVMSWHAIIIGPWKKFILSTGTCAGASAQDIMQSTLHKNKAEVGQAEQTCMETSTKQLTQLSSHEQVYIMDSSQTPKEQGAKGRKGTQLKAMD